MMSEFQSLYFNDDGYVIRCKQCGYYQVAFMSTMLMLKERDFQALYKLVKFKCNEESYCDSENIKKIIIHTPAEGFYIFLTKQEAKRFCEILEEADNADNEYKSQAILSLFNP